ncbi:hypothetical protein, partial [Dactylosporangium sucinum]|uniref:hypothetical protein n=2 Tax=Dactylosporangium sucinum TaxID=1424081 RepID=UPI00167E9F01
MPDQAAPWVWDGPVQGRVDVLLDPADDAAVTAALLSRHDPAAGRVVVHPTPGSRGDAGLAHDVLAALGVPVQQFAAERLGGAGPAWRAAAAWCHAAGVTELVVLRAHRLTATGWARLLGLSRASRAALRLVCHTRTVPAHLRTALAGVAHEVLEDLAVLPGRDNPPPGRAAASPAGQREFPALPGRLPTGQVLHYRADVYRRHPLHVFARVDDLYGRGLDAACRWLAHRDRPGPHDPPTDPRLQRFLTELVQDSPTRQHTTALLRGAQAGFLLHGSWLALPNLATADGPGLTTTPLTADVAARIRAHVAHPVLAAGVALALFTGLSLPSLRTLRLDALAPPTLALIAPRPRRGPYPAHQVMFHIPRPARPLLRAARVFLQASSDNPRQRIFAGFAPMPAAVEHAAQRCGLPLPRRPVELTDAWPAPARWTRLGEPIHTTGSSPDAPAGQVCGTAHPV